MPLQIPIEVHNRKNHTKVNLLVGFSEKDTVKSIGEQVSLKTGLPYENLSVVLCGRVLDESTVINDLLLGPATSLVVLVVEKPNSIDSLPKPTRETSNIGSFYLWCKNCNDLTRGKLRVYCGACSSSAVIVKNEPMGWKDVLISRRIAVDCEDCSLSDAFAQFRFKCVSCNEVAAPLSQVRGNWEESSCIICTNEDERLMFDLGCNHSVCRDCFTQYVETSLENGNFFFRAPYGYTISCPCTGCDYCVRDAHHFCVLGAEKYKRYQQKATEKLVALHDQGVFCPFPDCNSYFFWELDNEDGKTYCPSCYRQFCRNCKCRECTCNNQDDLTKITIAATTRRCPGCSTDTERNGGCAHMRCTSCGMNWCFRCVKPWSDECQWDHWFG